MESIILKETEQELNEYIYSATFDVVGYAKDNGKLIVKKYVEPAKWVRFHTDGSNTVAFDGDLVSEIYLEYSYNGTDWNTWTDPTSALTFSGGNDVYVRGSGNAYFYKDTVYGETNAKIVFGNDTDLVDVEGNVMALLDYDGDYTTIPTVTPQHSERYFCFGDLFSDATALHSVSKDFLPATTLAAECYYHMFKGCTSLENAPELPATTLAAECYYQMFYGCTSLVNAPELPATTLANKCYASMFGSCTSLVNAPELPATTLADECYRNMFDGCESLVNAPELPATTLATSCYKYMFAYCTSLVNAPSLPATTLAENCYNVMFSNCESLLNAPALPATTLADSCYAGMFEWCVSLSSVTSYATNISANWCLDGWLDGVASTGVLKVPNSMINQYPSGYTGIPSGWEYEAID